MAREVFTLDLLETKRGQDRSDREERAERDPRPGSTHHDEWSETHADENHDDAHLFLQGPSQAALWSDVGPVLPDEEDHRQHELNADQEVPQEVHRGVRDRPRSLVDVGDHGDEAEDDIEAEANEHPLDEGDRVIDSRRAREGLIAAALLFE